MFQCNNAFSYFIWPVSVRQNNGTLVAHKSNYGINNETYEIQLVNATETKVQVDIKFNSQLSNTLQGFYRVGYDDIDDKNKKYARCSIIFPC